MIAFHDIKRIDDARGSLCVIENLPFEIRRVYYLHNIAENSERGGHAHRTLKRLLVAVHGSLRVIQQLPVGISYMSILDRPDAGIYIEPMTWLVLDRFSPGAVCLVLASAEYDPADYIRDRAEWEALRAS